MEPNKVLGTRIRLFRQKRGLSQEQLGVLLGFEESSARTRISRYETGHHEPPYLISCRIANILSIPVHILYCLDESLLTQYTCLFEFD